MWGFPAFSRTQLGVIILLGLCVVGLYCWREDAGRSPAASPDVRRHPLFIEVTGRAANAGVYEFPTPPTLQEVWRRAGGGEPLPGTNPTLTSGTSLEIQAKGAYRLGRMSGSRMVTLGIPLNINQAAAEDLEALPGVGPELARRLVEHRRKHGPFRTAADLTDVPGVGLRLLNGLAPFITFADQGAALAPKE